jgi:hypothetical protein
MEKSGRGAGAQNAKMPSKKSIFEFFIRPKGIASQVFYVLFWFHWIGMKFVLGRDQVFFTFKCEFSDPDNFQDFSHIFILLAYIFSQKQEINDGNLIGAFFLLAYVYFRLFDSTSAGDF